MAWRQLPHLRPSVLFIAGEKSDLTRWGLMKRAAKVAGTGYGGNGGLATEKIKLVVLKKTWHTVPLEKVSETASALVPWL